MFEYVKGMIQNVPKFLQLTRDVSTPALDHLFEVNDCARNLPEDKAKIFHHYVAKLLYLSKRVRPEMQTAVGFLCMRVKVTDVDDVKKTPIRTTIFETNRVLTADYYLGWYKKSILVRGRFVCHKY